MCGIVGYIGPKNALKVVVEGLEKLEYRGYDSAGVAYVTEDKKVSLSRAQGKLSALKELLYKNESNTHAVLGIGHTRWATHGKPSEENAHPHVAGRVSLIHNGIIENYVELRSELIKKGAKFSSETDTEVAAHLLNDYLSQGLTPLDALKETCKRVRGSYAFVAIDSNTPDRMLVAKTATPIVVGIGEGEVIVASDIPAILPHTKQVKILEDGDIAEVTKDSISIFHEGKLIERKTQTITWDAVTAQKGGFKHFMLKEIHDQITASSDALRGRIMGDGISIPEVNLDFKSFDRIVITACGTAWHAGLVAKFFFESIAKIPTEVDYASEFRYRTPVLDSKTLAIAISQSGETADTLGAIDIAKKSSKTLAVCNVVGSSLTRKTDATIYTQAGPEVSVASTKAFTTQLLTVLLLALKMAQSRGVLSDVTSVLKDMQHVPSAVQSAIGNESKIEELARKIHTARDVIFLGRGICFPIALEGALKLKEISYIHAEGYPSGEIKHGPLALIDENVPVVILLHRSDVLLEKSISNLREVEARGGRVIAVTDTKLPQEILDLCEGVIEVPFISELMTPVIMTIPLQLLAYHVAVLNGTDVDLPRNLAKSVTVE